jgi:hypothetical protein
MYHNVYILEYQIFLCLCVCFIDEDIFLID